MRLSLRIALIGTAFLASQALAEPPTHIITFRGVTDKNNCIVQSKIVNVSHKKSDPFTVVMAFPGHPGLEPGALSYINFNIPKLDVWETIAVQDEVYGMLCSKMHIKSASGVYSIYSPEIWKLKILMSSELDITPEYVFIENPLAK
jgi:hypothetical protein